MTTALTMAGTGAGTGAAAGLGSSLPAPAGAGALGLDFSALMGAMTAEAMPAVADIVAPPPLDAASVLPQGTTGLETPILPLSAGVAGGLAASVEMAPPQRVVSQAIGPALASRSIADPTEADVMVAADSLPALSGDIVAGQAPPSVDGARENVPKVEDRGRRDASPPMTDDESSDESPEPVAVAVAGPADQLSLAQMMVVAPVPPVRPVAVEGVRAVRREAISGPADGMAAVPSPVLATGTGFAMQEAVTQVSTETDARPLLSGSGAGEAGIASVVPGPRGAETPAVAVAVATAMASVEAFVSAQSAAAQAPAAVAVPMMARPAPATAMGGGAMPPAMAMMQDVSALLAQAVPAAQAVVPAVASTQAAASPAMVATMTAAVSADPANRPVGDPFRQPKRREAVDADPAMSLVGADPAVAAIDLPMVAPARDALLPPMTVAQNGGGAAAISADAALGFHVDAARHGQELDQVARDIVATGNDSARLSFRLDSHRLGSVGVELTRQDAGLHVRLESGDATARDVIADQQQQFVTDARAAGVRIAETSVEAPRREEPATPPGATAPRGDPSSGQSAAGGQSSGGQAGGQRGSGQPPQPTPGWTQAARGAGMRTDRSAATPRDLYA